MKPRDARDKLFQGVAIGNYDPPAGIALMEEAEREGPVPRIAATLRAEVRILQAIETADVADAEAALGDIRAAAPQLPNNPVIVAQQVYANLAAATAYKVHSDPIHHASALKAAGDANALLDHFQPSVIAVVARQTYLNYVDGLSPNADPAVELLKVRPPDGGATVAFIDAINLFRQGKDDQSIVELHKFKNDRYCIQLRLVIALTNPAYRNIVNDVWEDLTPQGAPSERLGSSLRYAPFFDDGRHNKVIAQLERSGARAKSLTVAETTAFIQFAAGSLDNERLVATMTTRSRRSGAHFAIGLKWLANGDHDKARTSFTASHELMTVGWTQWDLATAFLIRMKLDREWPRAIPQKK